MIINEIFARGNGIFRNIKKSFRCSFGCEDT